MTLLASGVYALRCATLALGFLTIGIGAGRSHYSATVAFPALAGLGIAIGLFAFYGDYRARRGRRTVIGPVTRERVILYAVVVVGLTVVALGALALNRLVDGRPFTLGMFENAPFIVLFLLSFTDRLATWPWSEPAKALTAEQPSGEQG